MNLLNLPSLNILEVNETEDSYHIEAESSSPLLDMCDQCGFDGEYLSKFGTKKQLYADTPMHGKRVAITFRKQRYRCKNCGTTCYEILLHMNDRRLATQRLIDYVSQQSLSRTFTSIAKEVGMDEKTVRNIFRDYVNFLYEHFRNETPKWLGIDEIHIIKPRCVLTNIEENTIFDMLENRNKETLLKYLSKLPNRDQIQYVAMDMWTPYKDAVKAMMPQAMIVVDKFHVVRMANTALEDIRKAHRKEIDPKQRRQLMRDRYVLLKRQHDLTAQDMLLLDLWTANYPKLKMAYDLKEDFFKIWDSNSRLEAYDKYQHWLRRIPDEMKAPFKPIVTAMKNWEDEVFNYFDHPVTNAYTESVNNLIRLANRIGRGYSFEALKAKILFTEGIRKTKTTKHSMRSQYNTYYSMMSYNSQDYEETVFIGTDISTLVDVIEKGSF